MKTMAAGAFKTHCLSVIQEVHTRQEEVLITRRGKPMAKVVPVHPEKPQSLIGALKGKVRITRDAVSPVVEPGEWDEEIFPPEVAEGSSKPSAKSRRKK